MKRLIAPILLLAAGFALRLAARSMPGFADAWLKYVTPLFGSTIGRVTSFLPFSLVEWLIVSLLLYLVFRVFRILFLLLGAHPLKAKRSLFSFLRFFLTLGSLIFLLYEAGEDVLFYATPFSARHQIGTGAYDDEELLRVCRLLAERVNETSPLVERAADGQMENGEALEQRVSDALGTLGGRYDEFSAFVPRPKTVFFSQVMSRMHFSGIFSAYTYEANVNGDMPAYNDAFSMAHELAHSKGILREDEANFIAYLTCRDAQDPDIAYSGAMLGLTYCGNELNRRSREAYSAVIRSLDVKAQADLTANREFWARYKGKTSEVTEALNHSFLISHGQAEGVRTYDRVVDLIVSVEGEASE